MKVVLVFPFRDDAAKSRGPAFQVCKRKVLSLYDFDSNITVDSGHSKFNRAATRNLGVRQAEKLGADVVVLCDADSIPEAQPLHNAIKGCSDGKIHYPFNEVWVMLPRAINNVLTRSMHQLSRRTAYKYGESQGGIWVCTPESWWKAGGQDDRLNGWGCEDRAFLEATETYLGRAVHHQGVLMCLSHGRVAGEQWLPQDMELLERYQRARGDKTAMGELISERTYDLGSIEGSAEERGPAVRSVPGDVHPRHKTRDRVQP